MVYQGHGLGADRTMIAALGKMIGIEPDLTLVLDIPRAVAVTRLKQRGTADDRYERLNEAFHERVLAGFRAVAATPRCTLIDASGDTNTVHAAIMAAVQRLL